MTQTQATTADTMTITIDGREVIAPRGVTILEAAQLAGIYIPTLCYDERIKSYGACRMCVVEQEGRPGYAASCVTPAAPDASYRTNTPETVELRQSVLNLLMSEHPHGCLTCDRVVHCGPNDICLRNVSVTDRCVICPQNQRCELQATVEIVGVTEQLLPYTYRQLPVRTEDPYIDRDYNLCIACARCVRICDEVIGVEAISMVDRADRILPGTPNDVPLSDPLSGCIFCGACVDACPVGALTEKENKWGGLPDRTVTTVCTQCEIGCQLTVEMLGDKVLRVVGDLDGGANGGLACVLGKFQLADEARNEARLLYAQVRRNDTLEQVSWDDAIAAAADGLRNRRGDAFALVHSPKIANEDAYLLRKFARAAMDSANVTGTAQAEGSDLFTGSIRDIADAKAVLLVGADLEVTHPVAAFQIHKAVNYQDAALIGIGPERYKELGRAAQLWLECRPGTEPAVLSAMLSIIIAENLTDAALAENPADDYETLVQSLQGFDLDRAVADTGVSVDDLRQAARLYANTAPATTVYSVRDDDHDGIASLLANLALLTGNVGRAGGGVHLFRPGGGNVQGVYDVTTDPGVDLSSVVEGILAGRVTALYWVGDAPEMNDVEAARFHEAIERVDFLVVQGLVIDDRLAAHADVLLPAAAATEREGTYTNAERRVQRVRPFLLPPGDARPVWEAPAALSRLVGTNADGFSYADASHVFDEIAQSVPLYTGLSYDLLDSSLTGLVRPLT